MDIVNKQLDDDFESWLDETEENKDDRIRCSVSATKDELIFRQMTTCKIVSPHARNRKRYKRVCKKMGTHYLTRFNKQLGQVKVDMNCAGLRERDMNAICLALVGHCNLDRVDVSGNDLRPTVLVHINQVLQSETVITELNLSNNHLGGGDGSGVAQLARLTKENPLLRKLDISGNRINDDDGEQLANLIRDATGLWELKLNHNELRLHGGMMIGEALAKNDNLYTLDLSWNHLRGRGAECLALGLMKNNNLLRLDVSWNGFAFEGSVAMGYALKQNTSLTELNMASNRIHPPALWELWKGVSENRVLTNISLAYNPITTMATTPLLCMVRDKPGNSLEHLDLSGVVVDKEFEVVVDVIRETRPDFTVRYDRSLPVHKDKWNTYKSKTTAPVYNVDPVRILYYAKKNLRIIDMFNKMDKDKDARLTKSEIHQALKQEDFDLSANAIDEIFDYLDVDQNGYLDFAELLNGERRMKRQVLEQARVARERHRLDVEHGGPDGLAGDMGGLGGRFSQTFRPDLARVTPDLPHITSDPRNKSPSRLSTSPLPAIRTTSPLPPIRQS